MNLKIWKVFCHLGIHAYVHAHPVDERWHGPNHQVCRRCGKRRELGFSRIPPGFFGGGMGGGGVPHARR